MWLVFAGVALAAAVVLAPAALVAPADGTPPPEAVGRAAALGRTYAASDLAWLRTVQLMGDPVLEQARWPHLEEWVDLTTRFDPTFETPYHFGALLLVGDPVRAQVADRMLARGEVAQPTSFSLPAMRGFIAYFSQLDPAAAALHYHRAARLPGAPPFFEAFARRLEHQGQTCAQMLRDLNSLAAGETAEKRRALLAGREQIVLGCVEGQLKNAASVYRTRHGRNGSLDELRAAGLLAEEPFAPPGRCWQVVSGRPSLVSCAPPGAGP
ncbi:MAG: hypothetical protein HYS27_25970 [Deltaproteobacteria bacterium]|nr:hypothetical protein [Deltaproteobacteria bacterium]